jgi:hypothetical protein
MMLRLAADYERLAERAEAALAEPRDFAESNESNEERLAHQSPPRLGAPWRTARLANVGQGERAVAGLTNGT